MERQDLSSPTVRRLLFFVLVTALLSLLYGVQYFAGGPVRLIVTRPIEDLVFFPDEERVVAGSGDGTITLWELRGENWPMQSWPGHDDAVIYLGVAADDRLLSVGREGWVRWWDPATGMVEQGWPAEGAPLLGASLSTDGTTLATAGQDGTVRIWEAASGRPLQQVSPEQNPYGAVALSPDGSLLATGEGADVQVWNARTGAPETRLTGKLVKPGTAEEEWIGHEKPVSALVFGPGGAFLASGDEDGTLLVWDLTTGESTETRGHLGRVLDVAVSSDGAYLLSGGTDNTLRRWTFPEGKFGGVFQGHLGAVSGVTFGPEESVFSGGVDGSLRLWDETSEREQHLVWTREGLMPFWGPLLGGWLLGSGLLGLVLVWGLRRMRTWAYLTAVVLFLIGPILTVVLPLLETTAYAITWGDRLRIAWPLLLMWVWYGLLDFYLWRDEVAIPYQAPDATSLAEQLMASRRARRLRRGAFEIATWLLIFVLLFSALRRFGLDVAFMRKWLPFIMGGAGITLYVSAAAIGLATVLALVGALARLSNSPVANGISGFYISLIRGTPLLVQIFIWYLALPQIGVTLDPRLAGILALGVNYGAYMTEIFRAGIQAIGKGQHEAAQALGMTPGQTFRRIVFPQAFRIVIPPIGNEFIAMMKDSALVSIITVHELTFRAQKIGRQNFRNLETFLIAAGFYWILTIIFQFFQGKLETHMARGERR